MGGILDTPHTEKTTEAGNGNQCRFSVCSMQGWRIEMEDAHCAKIGLPQLKDWNFFAVFDGHAGGFVSEHCAENLLPSLLETEDFHKLALASLNEDNIQSNSTGEWRGGGGGGVDISESSPDAITVLSTEKKNLLEMIKGNIRSGFLKMDEKLRQQPNVVSGKDISGSTAVAVLISPDYHFFANCGDSRAVLSKKGVPCAFSTQDHKPSNPEEKDRIQKAGGSVMINRVNGSLAVSRALGDFQYKQVPDREVTEQLVSPEPEITIVPRSPDDEFIILACDGVWDVMKNEEVVAYVRHQLKIDSDLDKICSSLIDTCLHKGSTDNMSVILVTFPGAPEPDEEVRKLDMELNSKIEKIVFDLLRSDGEFQTSIYLLMNSLRNIDIPNLPPGGGLDAKRSLVEKAQKEYVRQNSNNDIDRSASDVPL